MCELNLESTVCYSKVIKNFIIKFIKMCQSNYFQNECCSITTGEAVMCELNLVKVQCVTVKLLTIFIIKIKKNVPKQLLSNECCSITTGSSDV